MMTEGVEEPASEVQAGELRASLAASDIEMRRESRRVDREKPPTNGVAPLAHRDDPEFGWTIAKIGRFEGSVC